MFYRAIGKFKSLLHDWIEEGKTRKNRIHWEQNTRSKTKRYFKEARAINFSNKPENIQIGTDTYVRGELKVLRYGGKIIIGNDSYVGKNSKIWSGHEVCIGHRVLISDNVFISDTNSHELNSKDRHRTYKGLFTTGPPSEKGNINTGKIFLGDDAWISYGAIILKGVNIGKQSIVAAGSVVTKDVPSGVLVAGNPAKIIKELDE